MSVILKVFAGLSRLMHWPTRRTVTQPAGALNLARTPLEKLLLDDVQPPFAG